MSLEVGDKAPDFSLPADNGGKASLKALKGKPVVLYFYPKDDTPGCTAEACAFRDALPDFSKVKAAIIGISRELGCEPRQVQDQVRSPLSAGLGRRRQSLPGLWRVGGEEHVRKEIHGHRAVDARPPVPVAWKTSTS